MTIRIDDKITIPAEVVDLESFCLWTCSDDFPEHGRFSYLAGLLWVDLSMEEIYRHSSPKGEIAGVLTLMARELGTGRFFPDGAWYRNDTANLSTEPDGIFVSYDALRSGRVQKVKSSKGVLFQLSGSADMTLEVVSTTSEAKDTKRLFTLYWKAGVLEYWLVDVREGACVSTYSSVGPAAIPPPVGNLAVGSSHACSVGHFGLRKIRTPSVIHFTSWKSALSNINPPTTRTLP